MVYDIEHGIPGWDNFAARILMKQLLKLPLGDLVEVEGIAEI